MKKQALSLLLALSLMSVPALAKENSADNFVRGKTYACLLYTSPSPRDRG